MKSWRSCGGFQCRDSLLFCSVSIQVRDAHTVGEFFYKRHSQIRCSLLLSYKINSYLNWSAFKLQMYRFEILASLILSVFTHPLHLHPPHHSKSVWDHISHRSTRHQFEGRGCEEEILLFSLILQQHWIPHVPLWSVTGWKYLSRMWQVFGSLWVSLWQIIIFSVLGDFFLSLSFCRLIIFPLVLFWC